MGRTCPPCRGSLCLAPGPCVSWLPTRPHRGSRRTRSCPCTRDRSPKPPAPGYPECAAPYTPPSKIVALAPTTKIAADGERAKPLRCCDQVLPIQVETKQRLAVGTR